MLNLTPILKPDQPTSSIKIGAKNVEPNTEIVEVTHIDTKAFFYVDQVDDTVVDGIGNKVRMHRNVTTVFGGIDRDKDFLVDPDVRKDDVVVCSSATIHTAENATDELESFLRGKEYLLHEIQEVVPNGDTLSTFEVTAMEPAGYTTLRISSETELEFVTEDERVSSESGEAAADDGESFRMSLDQTSSGSSEADETTDLSSESFKLALARLRELHTMDSVEDIGGIEPQVAGVCSIEETVETTSDEEVASIVDEIVDDLEQDTETPQQGSDEDA